MTGLFRWTKLQDFCLRLGLLKVLVAVQSRSRFGVARDQIARRLADVLFQPAPEELRRLASAVFGDTVDANLTVSQALLMASSSSSWGQPIKKETSYKILEWGQTVGLVGKGYRPTERGTLLHDLLPSGAVEAFFGGNRSAWNPFEMAPEERAFFFYHLGERDELLWELAMRLGRLAPGTIVTASDAYELTLAGMERVLERAEPRLPIPELPRFRTARELADTIKWELSREDAPPRRARRGPPPAGIPGKTNRVPRRKSKKNADHQTIPRFEQLVDLGFLDKPLKGRPTGKKLDRERKAWSFSVRPGTCAVSAALSDDFLQDQRWHWSHAATSLARLGIGEGRPRRATETEAVDLIANAYETVHRPVGHTPAETVLLASMCRGLSSGLIAEVADLHRMLLRLKRKGLLQDEAFFAAGNAVDQMFLLLKPGFREAYKRYLADEAR